MVFLNFAKPVHENVHTAVLKWLLSKEQGCSNTALPFSRTGGVSVLSHVVSVGHAYFILSFEHIYNSN